MIILEGKQLKLSYSNHTVIHNASISISENEIVSLIGPNGSGKSTLLKALCRLMKPDKGKTFLFGRDIWKEPTKEVAQKIAILPQVKHVQSDVTVRELVGFGRYPHKRFGQSLDREDKKIIEEAICATKLEAYVDRFVRNLSGGEQQRAWIAMALAQVPKILILDEPTTYLDISHQLEIMETIRSLNQERGMTIIMVLHDINQAVRFSDKICAIKDGDIVAFSASHEMITRERIRELFAIEGHIHQDETNHCPFFIPHRSQRQRSC